MELISQPGYSGGVYLITRGRTFFLCRTQPLITMSDAEKAEFRSHIAKKIVRFMYLYSKEVACTK